MVMNFEVFVLGTSGMMPLPNRNLTSALIRREGELFLFDCGEGTQISLKKLNLKWKKINSIFISHMHADHVTGLPGILMLSSQVDRDTPLTLYGPSRLKEYVDANRRILLRGQLRGRPEAGLAVDRLGVWLGAPGGGRARLPSRRRWSAARFPAKIR